MKLTNQQIYSIASNEIAHIEGQNKKLNEDLRRSSHFTKEVLKLKKEYEKFSELMKAIFNSRSSCGESAFEGAVFSMLSKTIKYHQVPTRSVLESKIVTATISAKTIEDLWVKVGLTQPIL